MKIWHLLSNRWNSAITEYALSAARALERVGHRSLLTPLDGAPAAQRARSLGLETRPLPGFSLGKVRSLSRIQADFRPDAIVAYGGPETFLTQWIHGKAKPLLVRFRGQDLPSPGFFTDVKQRFSLHHIDVVLTPSDVLAQAMQARALHPRVSSVVLGCDTHRFHRTVPRDLPRGCRLGERPEIVIFGRFDPVKGHREFMQVFARALSLLPAGLPRPLLHIVGEAANLRCADLLDAARTSGLGEGRDVRVTEERIANVPDLMSKATLGVVSSLGSEVICRVAEEFLLCGTPVLVSGAGSLKEVLRCPAFGATYQGLTLDQAAALLLAWSHRSWDEPEEEKVDRAVQAQSFFSLEVMGRALERLIIPG